MKSPADLSIRRPVATVMFYLIILTIGFVGMRHLPIDLLPEIEFPQVSIQTSYPNVGPEEMERLVTQPIENAVSGVGMERITSWSGEGISWITLEFSRGTDIAEASNDIRDALESVRNQLPPDINLPRLRKFNPDDYHIVSMAATSDVYDLQQLTDVVDRELVRRFEQIDGVGTLELRGGIFREIRIDLRRDILQAYGLTALDVQQAVSRESAIAPGGNVKDGLRDLYVRAVAEYENIDQIADVVVREVNGAQVRVRDLATVHMDYQDPSWLTDVDGMPVIQIRARKQSGANTVSVAQSILREIDRVNADRSDVELRVLEDTSLFIQQSIDNVRSSAIWGALLAILVLYFFLRNGSSTFIIALSIPISLIATFGLLYFRDLSLNQMTFGGLALGVGLIVDNAIVVLENIVRQREENGKSRKEAASVGSREVIGAIVASTLTTSVIFLPIVFMQTVTAVMFLELAIVVVFSLLCSLLVAITLVPMLASRFLRTSVDRKPGKPVRHQKFRERMDRFERRYSRWIGGAVRYRYAVFATTLALLGGAWWLSSSVPVELTPDTDANQVRVRLNMDEGTNLAVVQSYLLELEDVVRGVVGDTRVENITTGLRRGRGQIDITLPNPDERTVSSTVLADRIREAVTGSVPGAQIRVQAQSGMWILRRLFRGGGGDEAVQIRLMGHDQQESIRIGQEIRQRMEGIPGILDVNIGGEDDDGQPEQRIRLDRDRIAALGLTISEVAQAIQLNVGGGRAGRFREGGDEIDIQVRLRPEDRLTALDLENISIRTPEGSTVPLSTVATQERARGNHGIRRINGQRVTYISANLESGVALGDAVERIRADLRTMEIPAGYSIVFGGEYEEQQRAQRDFRLAILLAVALIYMVMAGQFERFLDPLIVMFSVPLALVGVIPTLWATGTTLNIQSLMGLIMLIGIVVNNAIVLVDYINLMRRERKMELVPAVIEAGRLRLRPILMTTVTTILGLMPLAIGLGAGGEIQAALARTVIGGLAASTLITLILIPVVYVSVHQLRERVVGWIWKSEEGDAVTSAERA
ncbi:MAG: efflux RND transporter permease subunit [Opitutales bacterium]|nr:efflux RND transporter permease subunit [Opitutales bacterium]